MVKQNFVKDKLNLGALRKQAEFEEKCKDKLNFNQRATFIISKCKNAR